MNDMFHTSKFHQCACLQTSDEAFGGVAALEEDERTDPDVTVTVDLADETARTFVAGQDSSRKFQTTVIIHNEDTSSSPASSRSSQQMASTELQDNNASNSAIQSMQSLMAAAANQSNVAETLASLNEQSNAAASTSGVMSNIRHSNEMLHHQLGSLFRRHAIKNDPRKVPPLPEVQRASSANPMSVSVPNLTASVDQTVSILESFSAVVKRNLGNNPNNMMSGSNNPCSSLVRLALSARSPGSLHQIVCLSLFMMYDVNMFQLPSSILQLFLKRKHNIYSQILEND